MGLRQSKPPVTAHVKTGPNRPPITEGVRSSCWRNSKGNSTKYPWTSLRTSFLASSGDIGQHLASWNAHTALGISWYILGSQSATSFTGQLLVVVQYTFPNKTLSHAIPQGADRLLEGLKCGWACWAMKTYSHAKKMQEAYFSQSSIGLTLEERLSRSTFPIIKWKCGLTWRSNIKTGLTLSKVGSLRWASACSLPKLSPHH